MSAIAARLAMCLRSDAGERGRSGGWRPVLRDSLANKRCLRLLQRSPSGQAAPATSASSRLVQYRSDTYAAPMLIKTDQVSCEQREGKGWWSCVSRCLQQSPEMSNTEVDRPTLQRGKNLLKIFTRCLFAFAQPAAAVARLKRLQSSLETQIGMTVGTANDSANGVAANGVANGHHKAGKPTAGSLLQVRKFQAFPTRF